MPGAKDKMVQKKKRHSACPHQAWNPVKQADYMFTEKCAVKQTDMGECVRQ